MSDNKEIGRLAFRVLGDRWIAYFALQETMDDAIELGSIRRVLVDNPDRKDQFITLMKAAFSDLCEMEFGERPNWGGPEKAPGHERIQ